MKKPIQMTAVMITALTIVSVILIIVTQCMYYLWNKILLFMSGRFESGLAYDILTTVVGALMFAINAFIFIVLTIVTTKMVEVICNKLKEK